MNIKKIMFCIVLVLHGVGNSWTPSRLVAATSGSSTVAVGAGALLCGAGWPIAIGAACIATLVGGSTATMWEGNQEMREQAGDIERRLRAHNQKIRENTTAVGSQSRAIRELTGRLADQTERVSVVVAQVGEARGQVDGAREFWQKDVRELRGELAVIGEGVAATEKDLTIVLEHQERLGMQVEENSGLIRTIFRKIAAERKAKEKLAQHLGSMQEEAAFLRAAAEKARDEGVAGADKFTAELREREERAAELAARLARVAGRSVDTSRRVDTTVPLYLNMHMLGFEGLRAFTAAQKKSSDGAAASSDDGAATGY